MQDYFSYMIYRPTSPLQVVKVGITFKPTSSLTTRELHALIDQLCKVVTEMVLIEEGLS